MYQVSVANGFYRQPEFAHRLMGNAKRKIHLYLNNNPR